MNFVVLFRGGGRANVGMYSAPSVWDELQLIYADELHFNSSRRRDDKTDEQPLWWQNSWLEVEITELYEYVLTDIIVPMVTPMFVAAANHGMYTNRILPFVGCFLFTIVQ